MQRTNLGIEDGRREEEQKEDDGKRKMHVLFAFAATRREVDDTDGQETDSQHVFIPFSTQSETANEDIK